MTQAGNISNNPVNKAYGYDSADTAYPTNSKNLGGLGNGPQDLNGDGGVDDLEDYAYKLQMWIAQQRDSGVQLSQQDLQTIQGYAAYCSQQFGFNWNPFMELGWTQQGPGMGGEYGPGSQGPTGNQTITDGGEFTIDGSVQTTDVWGDAVMNVPPPSTVVFETSSDGLNPAGTIVKAIVTNPAMKGPDGQSLQSVVKFHDGGKITCNASKKGDGTSRAVDHTGTVTIGEYKAGAEEGGKPEASIDGEYDAETNTYTYDGTGQETIKFWPQGSGVDGEITTHYAEASVDIYVKNTDRVYVYEKDGQWVTDVVHKDGSVDRIVQDKSTTSYTANINGVPEHIFFGSDENHEGGTNPTLKEGKDDEPDQMAIAGDYGEHFTVNGEESVEGKGIGGIEIAVAGPMLAGLVDTMGKKYPAELTALADFIYGKHDKATMDQLMSQLQATFGSNYNDAMLNVSAVDKPSFEEWMLGTGKWEGKGAAFNQLFDKNNPSSKVAGFLFAIDPTLAGLFSEVQGKYVENVEGKLKDIQSRLVTLLQQLGINAEAKKGEGGEGFLPGDKYPVYGIKIGGHYYCFYDPNQSSIIPGMGNDAKVGGDAGWYNAADAY